MIDSIKVVTEECHLSLIRSKYRPMKLYSIQRNEEKEGLTTQPIITSRHNTMSKLSTIKNSTTLPNSNSSFS